MKKIIKIIILLSFIFLNFGDLFSEENVNLLKDGELEKWVNNESLKEWKGTGDITKETAIKHGGLFSLKIQTSNKNDLPYIKQSISLKAGKTYRITCWAKGTLPSSAICFYIGDKPSPVHGITVPISTDWERYTWEFNAYQQKSVIKIFISSYGKYSPGFIYIDDIFLKEVIASNIWLERFSDEMQNSDYWLRLPMDIPAKSKVRAYVYPGEGSCLKFWDQNAPDYGNTNKSIYFARDIDVTDFTNYEKITFEMKGDGKKNALKLWLVDVDGNEVGYGPFWADSTRWSKKELFLKVPTWKWKGDEKFDLRKVSSIRISQSDKIGVLATASPIYIKDFKLVKEEGTEADSIGSDALLWKVSSINTNGNMVIDGQPFFPLGIYSVIGVDESSAYLITQKGKVPFTEQLARSWFKTIKDAGFNMVQSYTIPAFYGGKNKTIEKRMEGLKIFMDYAHDAELKVMSNIYGSIMVALPDKEIKRKEEIKRRKKEVKAHVEIAKNHPALAVYYIADEAFPAGVSKEQIKFFYDFIKGMDTIHPTLLVECSVPGFPAYKRVTDIFAPDIYPIDEAYPADISCIANRLDFIKTIQRGKPPKPHLWAVLQIYNKGKRFPTQEELRAMSFLALCCDVKGLVYFAYSWPDGTAPYSESCPDYWEKVSRVIRSIHTVFPALFSNKIIKNYKVNSGRIYSIAREVEDEKGKYLYLIAVNPADGEKMAVPLTVTFKLPFSKGAFIQALDEDEEGRLKLGHTRRIKFQKKGLFCEFTDIFKENTVHVYKIKK